MDSNGLKCFCDIEIEQDGIQIDSSALDEAVDGDKGEELKQFGLSAKEIAEAVQKFHTK